MSLNLASTQNNKEVYKEIPKERAEWLVIQNYVLYWKTPPDLSIYALAFQINVRIWLFISYVYDICPYLDLCVFYHRLMRDQRGTLFPSTPFAINDGVNRCELFSNRNQFVFKQSL